MAYVPLAIIRHTSITKLAGPRFLRVSLAAEAAYGAALAEQPGLLFENHIEPMLKAARA